jgi:endonuclease YncB( thermonuclease family)
VFDGDTFRVDIDTWPKFIGWRIPIRVKGINCPERRSKCPEEKAAAINAMHFTKSLLASGSDIVLERLERGKYFRIVADVKIDGRDLATALLDNGLAVIRN